MKMKREHFIIIQTAINELLAKHNSNGELVKAYSNGEFARAERCKDYQARFNNDLLYATGLSKWICDNLYSYLNDDHIQTALRAICPKLELKTCDHI